MRQERRTCAPIRTADAAPDDTRVLRIGARVRYGTVAGSSMHTQITSSVVVTRQTKG